MTDERLEMFKQRYQTQETPWDTGITPPELVAAVAELPPARAIDLGCGTGTNVRYLLEQGWQADGLDFVPQAIDMAREKLAAYPPQSYAVHCYDITLLDACDGLRPPYQLAVDIGCGHGLSGEDATKYARDLAGLMDTGGVFMLYAHSPGEDYKHGWTPDDVQRYFTPYFDIVWRMDSTDTRNGRPSAWYRLHKRA